MFKVHGNKLVCVHKQAQAALIISGCLFKVAYLKWYNDAC